MNTQILATQQDEWVERAIQKACDHIAPVWPLDKSIAVNPWWTMRDETMPLVAAKLQSLGNVKMLMDRSYYLSLWNSQITPAHLSKAATILDVKTNQDSLLSYLNSDEKINSWQHLGDMLDQQICHIHKTPWHDEIVHQISQFTALYFQYPERMQLDRDAGNSFYKMWLDVVRRDKGIEILMAESGLHAQFNALPNTITALFHLAKDTLGSAVDEAGFTHYCHALLLDINGWASWMANQAWQAAFANKSNNLLHQLLAVRLAWDIALWRHSTEKSPEKFAFIREAFIQQLNTVQTMQQATMEQHRFGWVWQTAMELSYQKSLNNKLLNQLNTNHNADNISRPELQAIFCIDVRSEPIRRALELQSPSIKTSGFAGFFGLPIDYIIEGSEFVRPQLPGLLNASLNAIQSNGLTTQHGVVFKAVADKKSSEAAPATFGVIEAKGLLKAANLLKSSFFPSQTKAGIASSMTNGSWTLLANNRRLEDTELASLVVGIMRAMNLRDNFAARILLVGHASCTTNNPHSAGLDCGACGGQSGEINVKVLAQILNSDGVRLALKNYEIDIPKDTTFVACLHNTTTDDLHYFDNDNALLNEPWTAWLLAATETAQRKRSSSVGISQLQNSSQLKNAFEKKSKDWAQLRPEWGLANNAAFIVAPRELTINIDLEGRSFLHDYDWKKDTDFSILELIITAPMVVTNWINLQYYASVTDNQKYGSGNKLLHNVVGGNMGVFEGNGGDLRIGLPFQSVNDGQNWRHQPLRLNVYIAAPKHAISNIVAKHKHIEALMKNSWIYLFQVNVDEKTIYQLTQTGWAVFENEGAI